jgi:hypothetical protein
MVEFEVEEATFDWFESLLGDKERPRHRARGLLAPCQNCDEAPEGT